MKPTLEMVKEPCMAWAIWKALQHFSDLLWERYEEDFQELGRMEGYAGPHLNSKEELERIEFDDQEEAVGTFASSER